MDEEQPLMFDLTQLECCGEDVRISDNVKIKLPQHLRIGNHCAIESGFVCTTRFSMGDYSHVSYYVTCIGGARGVLTAGHFFNASAGCRIICVTSLENGGGLVGPIVPSEYRDGADNRPISVGNFVTLGTDAIIMPGVNIGDGVVIGANSLVRHDCEPWTIYVGSPAKPIKKYNGDNMRKLARELGYNL